MMNNFFGRYGPVNTFIDKNIKWIFPLPAALFILLMMAFPVVFTFGVSLTDWSMSTGGASKFVGFANYIDMFKDQRFYNSVFNTFYFTILTVAIETVFGVLIAVGLNKEFVGKNLVKTILLLPMVTTPVAIGLAWTLFYEPTIGLANYMLKLLGLHTSNWIASTSAVIPSIAIVDIWEWTPMIALIVLAGLAGLPSDPFESAVVDGAKPHQIFFQITLPLLKPTIMIAIVLRSIEAFKTFDIIYTMTGGGPGYSSETLNILSYKLAFGYFKFGASSATLFALFAIVFSSSIVILLLRKRGSE